MILCSRCNSSCCIPNSIFTHLSAFYELAYIMASMHRKSRLVDTWHAEIISISLSLLSLLAMLLILGFYNGKVLFNWHKVTINTVISIFATISRMCLMFAVSSGLGQLRWNWFSGQSRPLVDFDTLDAASRGAIGSFRLLWTTRSW